MWPLVSLTSNISAFTASKVKSRDSFEKLRPCRYRYSFCYLAQGSWNFWYLIEVFGTWRNKQGGHQNFVWMCLQTDWTIFLSFFYRFLCSSVHINNLRESVYKVLHFCEDYICDTKTAFYCKFLLHRKLQLFELNQHTVLTYSRQQGEILVFFQFEVVWLVLVLVYVLLDLFLHA